MISGGHRSPDGTPAERRAEAVALADELKETRALTLRLAACTTDDELHAFFDPDFSPVGWHLGHVAMFEARWLLETTHGEAPISERFDRIFDPRAVEKPRRGDLPDRATLLGYASEVRRRVLDHLARDAESRPSHELLRGLDAYRLVLAHEQQHDETMAAILRMRPLDSRERSGFPLPEPGPAVPRAPLRVSAGIFLVGSDAPDVYDNERQPHEVAVAAFEIDWQPATNRDWLEFIDAGGYSKPELWSDDGLAWLERSRPAHPSTWEGTAAGYRLEALGGETALPPSHPVEGVSAFEAEAYATFRGARLPSEAEWEVAARLAPDAEPRLGLACGAARAVGEGGDFLGNVWEWTSTAFAPYPGFRPHPDDGYSAPYFDGRHRVLRGGSWATQRRVARVTFRNWYEPRLRAIFAGVRLARG